LAGSAAHFGRVKRIVWRVGLRFLFVATVQLFTSQTLRRQRSPTGCVSQRRPGATDGRTGRPHRAGRVVPGVSEEREGEGGHLLLRSEDRWHGLGGVVSYARHGWWRLCSTDGNGSTMARQPQPSEKGFLLTQQRRSP
jgi:hypothetical protein